MHEKAYGGKLTDPHMERTDPHMERTGKSSGQDMGGVLILSMGAVVLVDRSPKLIATSSWNLEPLAPDKLCIMGQDKE